MSLFDKALKMDYIIINVYCVSEGEKGAFEFLLEKETNHICERFKDRLGEHLVGLSIFEFLWVHKLKKIQHINIIYMLG